MIGCVTIDATGALIPLASTLLGVVVGGWVAHRTSLARDARGEQRTRRVGYLVEAYRAIERSTNHSRPLTSDQARVLEQAVADVMLLGQAPEVDAATEFIREFADGGGASAHALLVALRASLRQELALDETMLPKPFSLRIETGAEQSPNASGADEAK